MIIVAGRIYVRPGRREAFIAASLPAVEMARRARGCRDFVVAADPLEDDRVNVYEAWDSEGDLEAFRGEGPGDDLSADIASADVQRYYIERTSPA
jgi:quinol monooxygenase YgiN